MIIAHRNFLRKGGVFFFTRDGAYMIKTIKVSQIGARVSVAYERNEGEANAQKRSMLLTFTL